MTEDLNFDDWFDIFIEKVRQLGYSGPVDKYSFEWNYEDNETPEFAASEFVQAMNS